MSRPVVNISYESSNLGFRRQGTDGVCALVMNGVAVSGGAQLNTNYQLFSSKDADALKLTAAYDTANQVLVRNRIQRFFDQGGVELWIRLTDQSVSMADMFDVQESHARLLLQQANGRVKMLAVARNPDSYYSATVTSAIDQDSLDAIPLAQELADEFRLKHQPVLCFVEGRAFTGAIATLPDLRALDCADVVVCIAKDDNLATVAYAEEAASVEALLGTHSKAQVHLNVGWLERFPLGIATKKSFQKATTSSDHSVTAFDGDSLDVLHDKGYVFTTEYSSPDGLSGVYWDDNATCAAQTSDFLFSNDRRTAHKLHRTVVGAILPMLKGPLRTDPNTGKLSDVTIQAFRKAGTAAIEADMFKQGEVDGYDVYLDPEQKPKESRKLEIRAIAVNVDSGRTIDLTIGIAQTI